MRRRIAVKLEIVIALFCISACVDGPTTSPPPPVDVTGTWTGDIDSNTGPPGYTPVLGTISITLHFTQSGSRVDASMSSSSSILVGPATGYVSGRRLQVTITVPPCGGPGRGTPGTLSFVGDVDSDDRTMQVHYLGTECSGDGTGVLTRNAS
jgi:hypothetical protein